jgi:formylmethanofuran dehydrogenase subunit E
MNISKKAEIEFVTLECGHTLVSDIGAGVCSNCGKLCCRECLQLIDDKLLCPKCFARFVRDKNVEDSR